MSDTNTTDFDQDSYIQKVDSAHDKLRKIEGRLHKIEELTDASLLLKVFGIHMELSPTHLLYI